MNGNDAAQRSAAEPRCRKKREALGLAYPRSSCDECGTLLRHSWRCAEEAAAETALAASMAVPAAPGTSAADRARGVIECVTTFLQGCGNAGPKVASLGQPSDPLECAECVDGFLNAVRAVLSLDGLPAPVVPRADGPLMGMDRVTVAICKTGIGVPGSPPLRPIECVCERDGRVPSQSPAPRCVDAYAVACAAVNAWVA